MAQDPSAESLAAGGSLAAVQAMPVRSHAPAAAAAASSAPPWADVDAATWGLANATVPEKPDDRLPPDVDAAKLSDAEVYRVKQSVRIRAALAAKEEAAAADLAAAKVAAAAAAAKPAEPDSKTGALQSKLGIAQVRRVFRPERFPHKSSYLPALMGP